MSVFWTITCTLVCASALFALFVLLRYLTRGPFVERGVVWKPLERTGKTVAIIGAGLSGIQSLKTSVAEGWDAVLIERLDHVGGLWQFKEKRDCAAASVYESTHIDTGRDLNSFGDFSVTRDRPIIMHNKDVANYLNQNIDEFGLRDKIRFNTTVVKVAPTKENSNGRVRWHVTTKSTTSESAQEKTELFDAVMICTGRHRKIHLPAFPGVDQFQGETFHSAEYKSPKKNNLLGKKVVVVGIGNSGSDIATELASVCETVDLVSRSGSYVFDLKGVPLTSMGDGGRLTSIVISRIPWQWQQKNATKIVQNGVFGDQNVLKQAGLAPDYGVFQSHPTGTGLHGKTTFIEEVRNQNIRPRRKLTRFTRSGVIFDDAEEATEVDVVIFATGFKQGVEFVDKSVVDLSFERKGNRVPLYQGMFVPNKKFESLCFINFIQSASFLCADLQTRLFFSVVNDRVTLPCVKQQLAEIVAVEKTLSERFVDRPRHKVQQGLEPKYYEALAKQAQCQPTLWRILMERPEALWAAFIAPISSLTYRLVGPGSTKHALQEIHARATDMKKGHISNRFDGPPPLVRFLMLCFGVVAARINGYDVSENVFSKKHLQI